MKRFAILVAVASKGVAESLQGSELQCIGRAAHRVSYTLDGDEVSAVTVVPASENDDSCRHTNASGLAAVGGDRHFCVGANQDTTCEAAAKSVIPFPFGTRCQGCFIGAESDLFYTLNLTRFQLEHIGVGFRGTRVHSTVQIMDDKGKAPARQGSITLGKKPLEWSLKIAGKTLATFRVSMPTELYYKDLDRDNWHTDAGVNVLLDMGENSIDYTKGSGWTHRHDQAQVHVAPIIEGDYNAQANVTVGIKSQLELEVVDVIWFKVKIEPEVSMLLTSVGASGAEDLIHTCATGGLHFDLGHEADLHLSVLNRTVAKHWGPTIDRHSDNPSALHKCIDIHRKKPEPTLIV